MHGARQLAMEELAPWLCGVCQVPCAGIDTGCCCQQRSRIVFRLSLEAKGACLPGTPGGSCEERAPRTRRWPEDTTEEAETQRPADLAAIAQDLDVKVGGGEEGREVVERGTRRSVHMQVEHVTCKGWYWYALADLYQTAMCTHIYKYGLLGVSGGSSTRHPVPLVLFLLLVAPNHPI